MGTDEMNVSEQKFKKIGMRTCSKTQKYSIAYNFFTLYIVHCTLYLKSIVLKRGIQLNKNFPYLTYPVLTTTQNNEKLHIVDQKYTIAHNFFNFDL